MQYKGLNLSGPLRAPRSSYPEAGSYKIKGACCIFLLMQAWFTCVIKRLGKRKKYHSTNRSTLILMKEAQKEWSTASGSLAGSSISARQDGV